jgi:predicted metal-binding protein
MSACSHACVVALAHPAKHTYLFGNLPHTAEALPSVHHALADCAAKYLKHHSGMVGWSERPDADRQLIFNIS